MFQMDYADSQSGLRSVSASIPRYTGMERGGAINLVFDDSVSITVIFDACYKWKIKKWINKSKMKKKKNW